MTESSESEAVLRVFSRKCFRATVSQVVPDRVVEDALSAEPELLSRLGDRQRWLAVGKAAAALRRGALKAVSGSEVRPVHEWLVQPLAAPEVDPPILVGPGAALRGEHPVPGPTGAAAAARILGELEQTFDATTGDLVLLSGGASAMVPAPAVGVSLADKALVTRQLLEAGASIHQLNTVRRHLSRIKGGGLARALTRGQATRPVTVLVLSDVLGDDLATIASGPCVGDPTTYGDALRVLREVGVEAPDTVLRHLERGFRGEQDETPDPGDPLFSRIVHRIVAGNDHAVRALVGNVGALDGSWVVRCAVDLEAAESPSIRVLETPVARDGEARDVAEALVRSAVAAWREAPGRPLAVVWGGETTVTVRGDGVGGRNQEFALAAAVALDEALACDARSSVAEWAVLAAGTDGVDGPTPAAGACLDRRSLGLLRTQRDPHEVLCSNDSFTALRTAGALVETGPTGTNVADLALVLIGPRDGAIPA